MSTDDPISTSSALPATAGQSAEAPYAPRNTREVYGAIWRMGYPSMIGFGAVNLYTLADLFWVSRIGPDAVAALTIFSAFYWVISSMNMIAGTGSVAVISRRFGERDIPKTEVAIAEAFFLKIVLAASFSLVGYWLTPQIMELLGARGEVLQYSIVYGRIMFLGLVFNFPCWTVYTALRGIGQPRAAMMLMIASTILNAAIDPIFIFPLGGYGLGLGVAGAAWASLVGFAITIIGSLVMFFAGAFRVRLNLSTLRRAHVSTMWQMLKIGIPAGIGSISFSLGRMVIMPMVAHFGAPVIAVYGAGERTLELAILMVVGLEMGMSPLIGHALGSRNKALAWLTACKAVTLGTVVTITCGVLVFLLAGPVTRLFFDGQPYLNLGIAFFHIHALSLPFIGAFIMFEGAFTGAGDTVPPMVIGMIHSWAIQIPVIYLLAYQFNLGPNGIWWAVVISDALGAGLFVWWFSKKRWLERQV
jgi:putative MATE family efflux protein